MPHFIVHCSSNVLNQVAVEELIHNVHDTALATELFGPRDIKVRVQAFDDFTVGGEKNDFIHVFGHIMGGRTQEQKKDLALRVTRMINEMCPDVPIISMNVSDFEKSTYCNKTMI